MSFKLLFRYRVYGKENLPKAGPYIIASNHVSFLDPIAAGLLTRRMISFIAREDLFDNKIFAFIIGKLGVIPIERGGMDVKAIREALRRLKRGGILMLFPEGRRSFDGNLGKPLEGVEFLARKAKVRVVPVYLEGTNLALPRNARFIRLKRIQVFIGKAICPANPDMENRSAKLTQRIWEEMYRLKEKAILYG